MIYYKKEWKYSLSPTIVALKRFLLDNMHEETTNSSWFTSFYAITDAEKICIHHHIASNIPSSETARSTWNIATDEPALRLRRVTTITSQRGRRRNASDKKRAQFEHAAILISYKDKMLINKQIFRMNSNKTGGRRIRTLRRPILQPNEVKSLPNHRSMVSAS